MKLNEKMEKIKTEIDSDKDFERFKGEVAKHYDDSTGDMYENALMASYQVLIQYKTPMCQDHKEPLKFCHKCEEVVAREIFKRIWDLEFDGLDKKLTPEMEEVLKSFWTTMQNLRRDYMSDEIWNGGK